MIHFLIVVCVITCICDLFGALLQRLSVTLQKLEGNRTPKPPTSFSAEGEIPNPTGMMTGFAFSRINIFMILRFCVGAVSFISNLILPYYLLSVFTAATNASYHRQTHSYTPFMILDLHLPSSAPEVLPTTELAVEEASKNQDASGLTSFNRYIAFMVAKVAMKHIYSTFHAIYSPAGYLEKLQNRDKPEGK